MIRHQLNIRIGVDLKNIEYVFDGLEALTLLVNNMKLCRDNLDYLFSLIIIDYHIPTMDGLEVIKKGRERFKINNLPFP